MLPGRGHQAGDRMAQELAKKLARKYPGPFGDKSYVETPNETYASYLKNYLKRDNPHAKSA